MRDLYFGMIFLGQYVVFPCFLNLGVESSSAALDDGPEALCEGAVLAYLS
jgi:hypothetical protein